MNVTGIIAEYNPFHNGHAYQLKLAREGADYVVAVMSGSFVQRGEPAIYDKWTRARWAVENGADAVLELPCVYSLQSAEGFARGAVGVLHAAGCNRLCFGSEYADTALLKGALDLERSTGCNQALKDNLALGMTLPRARHAALADSCSAQMLDALQSPNFILGMEYLKAMEYHHSPMEPFVIKRVGSSYHSPQVQGHFSSAAALRELIASGRQDSLPAYMPPCAARDAAHLTPAFFSALEGPLLYALRTTSTERLERLCGVREGLENAIKKASGLPSLDSLLTALKSKRYTLAAIKRILCCALLGVSRELASSANGLRGPYLRLLACREGASPLLSRFSKAALITKKSQMELTGIARDMLNVDILATDLQALAFSSPVQRAAGRDFTQKLPVITAQTQGP